MECQLFSAMMIGPRKRQEDCIIEGRQLFQSDLLSRKIGFVTGPLMLAVCDGMGGHYGGEMASRFVCEQLRHYTWSGDVSGDKVHYALLGIQSASERHLPAQSGTTIAGLFSDGRRALIFNAGDSRVYGITAEKLEYLSHDHSLVQDLIDQSLVSMESAAVHPYRHLIDFGLGPAFSRVWSERDLYIVEQRLEPSAAFLLCSDGLTDILSDTEIHEILAPSPVENGARLANAARKKGLTDNTSFIIARITGGMTPGIIGTEQLHK
ncbi:MAG: protein phosphatase 2C domain-containing protein [Desulfobacteraceae bacterium]|nr:protein phosphatase 2C domain-containing protein [Desulfobacteraceae bacterium]